jgi:Domain of unknown function (DUF6894)
MWRCSSWRSRCQPTSRRRRSAAGCRRRSASRSSSPASALDDAEGLELAGEAAAREEARLFARDLAHGKLMAERDWVGWQVTIADERGQPLDSIPIAKLDS